MYVNCGQGFLNFVEFKWFNSCNDYFYMLFFVYFGFKDSELIFLCLVFGWINKKFGCECLGSDRKINWKGDQFFENLG